ncbi:hypothetical protein DFH07DRAFT_38311 [Mycena maculata]|uniref:Uncharacterized protein n=1 Tax=Mycena maculata TaxID=230809 RepID=A0AAD7IGM1_9AGAR|nr:hypothetical protein DFH07DRAFT_38311 [Mycena maculata]
MTVEIYHTQAFPEYYAARDEADRSLIRAPFYDMNPGQTSDLYTELFTFLKDNHKKDSPHGIYARLFEELGVEDPDEMAGRFFAKPPRLIIAQIQRREHSCHFRVDDLADTIFLASNIWLTWARLLYTDPGSFQAMSAREVVKATIVHELAHCAVSFVSLCSSIPTLIFFVEHRRHVESAFQSHCATTPERQRRSAGYFPAYLTTSKRTSSAGNPRETQSSMGRSRWRSRGMG